jgi:hypothetical protein
MKLGQDIIHWRIFMLEELNINIINIGKQLIKAFYWCCSQDFYVYPPPLE